MPASRGAGGCKRYFLLVELVILALGASSELYQIKTLIRRWAPMVWLAPFEKYYPLSIEEYLKNVFSGDANGKPFLGMDEFSLPIGRSSESMYLHTKVSLGNLKNDTSSFLYGKNPNYFPVPVYAVMNRCNNSSTSGKYPSFQVSYWQFYPYNEGKKLCFLGNIPTPQIYNVCLGEKKLIGNHVGDFEHITMLFRGKPYPYKMYVSAHDFGTYYRYNPVRKVFKIVREELDRNNIIIVKANFPLLIRTDEGRPVLFSAHGSHGLWGSDGLHNFVKVPKLSDYTEYGTPWKTWFNLRILDVKNPHLPLWTGYRGKWGSPKSKCLISKLGICQYSDGPDGILNRTPDFSC